ncbi:MAG: serine hydrolase domain-containing protein [Weeksellaceae bacterium]|nr:serine hydrolase domain-containing protein [Weeksellaceae bacterium]
MVFLGCAKETRESVEYHELVEMENFLPMFENEDFSQYFSKDKEGLFARIERKNALDAFFRNSWQPAQVSGGLLVAHKGEIIFEDYLGYANFEQKTPLNAATPIHIASISKVMTAAVVLKLVEKNYLKLQDKVSKHLPSFPDQKTTIMHLLNHRSGLPKYEYFPHDAQYWDSKAMQSNENILRYLAAGKGIRNFETGTSFAYSNTNYALLALIIEKVTKKKYHEVMRTMLFEPLEMKNTFVFHIEDSARVSQSYTFYNKRWEFNFLDNIYGDKNIYSTPQDILKFDKAMYSTKFLSKSLKKQMKSGYSYEKRGVKNYGLGIRLMEFDNGKTLYYHNGWWHGNFTTYVHGEEEQFTIIALGNRQTREVYDAFRLSGLFGEYPIPLNNVEAVEETVVEVDSLALDSIQNPAAEILADQKPDKELYPKDNKKDKKPVTALELPVQNIEPENQVPAQLDSIRKP